jgi:hypothetical protein
MYPFTPLLVVLIWMVSILPARSAKRASSYIEIAQAIVDACELDVVCMAELTAVAGYESDFSTWARGKAGEVGPWQIKSGFLPHGNATSVADQAIIARERIAESKRRCAANAPLERLADYTSGDCRRGLRESRQRLRLAADLLTTGTGRIER